MIPFDDQQLRRLIEGSCVTGADYSDWYAMRRFNVDAIHRDGAILDVGCTKGFLPVACKAGRLTH